MIARGIVRHPRVTFALTALAVAIGLFCMRRLPLEVFPDVAPPTFQLVVHAEGLDAVGASRSVAAPLEEALADVSGVLYHSSSCTDDGVCRCDVTFRSDVSQETALSRIKELVRRTEGKLPASAASRGVEIVQGLNDTVALYAFSAKQGAVPRGLVSGVVKSRLLGVDGVGRVEVSGERRRTVRIVLDTVKLSGLRLSLASVAAKLNACRGRGERLREEKGDIVVEGLVNTLGDFGGVVVCENANTGGRILLKDISRMEVYDSPVDGRGLDGREVVMMRVRKRAGANASDTAVRVKSLMEDLSRDFPEGVACELVTDAASGARTFMRDMAVTPLLAFLFVGVVLLVFWRSLKLAVIPLIVAVASIVSSFVLQWWFAFTFNALTVFGFVLVIGSLVDTALIVIERARIGMASGGQPPRQAMEDAVRSSFGVMFASTILVAVCYIPLFFCGGVASRLHLQFAFTACMALALSAVFALTLAPVVFALFVRDQGGKGRASGDFRLSFLLRGWERLYLSVAGWFVKHPVFACVVVMVGLCCFLPLKSILPKVLFGKDTIDRAVVEVVLPPECGNDKVEQVCAEASAALKDMPDLKRVMFSVGEGELQGNGGNCGRLSVEFNQRLKPARANAVLSEIRNRLSSIQDARIGVFVPSSVRGIGRFDGLEFSLCRHGGAAGDLSDAARALAAQIEGLDGTLSVEYAPAQFRHQAKVTFDHAKVSAFGVAPNAGESAIQEAVMPRRLPPFGLADGACDVVLAKSDGAVELDALEKIQLRAAGDALVPLAALGKVSMKPVPLSVTRFNGMDSVAFVVRLAPGASPERLVQAIGDIPLPEGCTVAWSGIAVQENVNRGGTRILVGIALFAIYLLLAAWYESWTLPIPVVGAASVAILGSLLGLLVTGAPLNIYAQVSLVVVVGVVVKLAVLVVGSARNRFAEGRTAVEAASESMRRTFLPVQMAAWTSLAGCVPLLFAVGLGTSEQFVLGVVAVFGIAATIFVGLFLVPALYVAAERLDGKIGVAPLRIRSRRSRKPRRRAVKT